MQTVVRQKEKKNSYMFYGAPKEFNYTSICIAYFVCSKVKIITPLKNDLSPHFILIPD